MDKILNYVYLAGIVGLIACVLFLQIENTRFRNTIGKQESTITLLTTQKDALANSNKELKASIDTQNLAVSKLGEIQEGVTALFTTFNNSVISTNKQIAGVKEAISKEKVPLTCQDTIQYLKDAKKEYK